MFEPIVNKSYVFESFLYVFIYIIYNVFKPLQFVPAGEYNLIILYQNFIKKKTLLGNRGEKPPIISAEILRPTYGAVLPTGAPHVILKICRVYPYTKS